MKYLVENFKKINLRDIILKISVLSLLILFVPHVAMSANHYIRDGATGNGSSWSNAMDDLPSTFVRGDTYYVADGNYGSHTFSTPASGSTYIHIKKATESDHGSDTGWNSSYGDGVAVFEPTIYFNSSYWVFDGAIGSGDGSLDPHGFVIDYSSGTGINVKLIRLNNSPSHITVKHTAMLHAGGLGSTADGRDSFYTTSASNITVAYCYIYDSGRCPFLFRRLTDSVIEYCYIRKNESTSADHAEGISAYIGCARNIVRHNVWDDTEGTGVLMIAGDRWEIYGNLMINFSSNDCAIGTWRGKDQSSFGLTNTKIYNNTIVNGVGYGQGTAFYDGDQGNEVYNNLWYNCSNINFRGTQTHNYNLFDDGTYGESNSQHWTGGSSLFTNYSSNNPTLAMPTQNGISLGSPYHTDMAGRTRGADGLWDIGAFEYSPGADPYDPTGGIPYDPPTDPPTDSSTSPLKIIIN